MHLKYDMIDALHLGEKRHAQVFMKDSGITYTHSVPQSMLDCFWFFNCENIPNIIPLFLSELLIDPKSAIGYGLSPCMAEEIISYIPKGPNQ